MNLIHLAILADQSAVLDMAADNHNSVLLEMRQANNGSITLEFFVPTH